ncbi:MAG: glycosyltransferase, partial [Eubacterium sp.]|nr:glycosyltransferase [Eubacterium sp.]
MMEAKRKKLVLKIALSVWKNASRDKRELGVVKELGADVLVMAKGEKSGILEQVDGFDVYRMSTRPLGEHMPVVINRIVSVFTWVRQIRKISPQVISGHDLPGLFIGYLYSVSVSKKRKPKLVYDSHEFELGRNANRSRAVSLAILHLERFLIKRCAFSIMVNDSIADEVQRIHRLKRRPIVVRSIPENWTIDDKVCQETREKLLNTAGKSGGGILLMYHGMVCSGRGIENLIRV